MVTPLLVTHCATVTPRVGSPTWPWAPLPPFGRVAAGGRVRSASVRKEPGGCLGSGPRKVFCSAGSRVAVSQVSAWTGRG